MRRTVLVAVSAVLLATAVFALTGNHPAQSAPGQSLNFFPTHEARVYPTGVITGKVGEVRAYVGDFDPTKSTDQGKYRATCVWLGAAGDRRLDCTVVLQLVKGMLVVHGLVDPPGSPQLLAQKPGTPTPAQLAITGGTGAYNGARGYVQLSTTSFTVVIP